MARTLLLAVAGLAAVAPAPAHAAAPGDVFAADFELLSHEATPGLAYYTRGSSIVAVDPFAEEPEPTMVNELGRDPAVSHDGTRLAFVREVEGTHVLVVSDARGGDAQALVAASDLGRPAWGPEGELAVTSFVEGKADILVWGREGTGGDPIVEGLEGVGRTLSWSPDGKLLAFDQLVGTEEPIPRLLVTLDVESGEPTELEEGTDPSYGPDGDIVFERDGELRILQADGEESTSFVPDRADGEPTEFQHRRPAYSPDGNFVIFERENGEGSWITFAPLPEGRPIRLSPVDGDACCPAWAAELPSLPGISIDDTSSEEGSPLDFTVSIPRAAATDVTVTATTQQGTATNNVDFTERVDQVRIPAGETQATFAVQTTEDESDEDDETLSVLLSSPSGGVINDGLAVGTIADDDSGPPPPTVSIADTSILEGFDLRFEVSLSAPASTDVTVTASTSPGTAGSGDFTATTEQVTIPAGQTNAGFVVPTTDDTSDEAAETLTATLSSPSGATIGDGSATGTIVDRSRVTVSAPTAVAEGGTLRFPVRLDHAAASQVTVRLSTEDGTATAPGDYTARSDVDVVIPAGQTEAFFDVVTREDFNDEGNETVTAEIVGTNGPAGLGNLSASGTIQNKPPPTVSVFAAPDATEGTPLQFPVRLSEARPGSVTVNLTTDSQNSTASTPGDYTSTTATVTIPAGQTEGTFTVPTVDDGFDEPNETVRARITGGTNAVPQTLAANGTILDNDEPPPTVSVNPAPAVNEGGTLAFPVRLSAPRASNVTVNLTTDNLTATAPGDYTSRTATVTIPPGQTEGTFTVATVDDGFDEPDETVRARITGGTNATPATLQASGTIRDNDEPLPVIGVHAPAAVDEGDALRFPIRLNRAAAGQVSVRLSTTDGTATAPGDYTAQTLTQVTIPAGSTEAFLEVPTATDELAESDETVRADIKSGTNATPGTISATGTIRNAVPVRLLPGKVLGGRLFGGTVLVRPPGSDSFIDLGAGAGLPVGTQVDVREGVLELINAFGSGPVPFPSARTQRARFSGGVFTIRQRRRTAPVTLVLSGRELRACRRNRKAARRLWADGRGNFGVKGRYAAATSRSGRWLVEDRCGSTRVKVTRGRAKVSYGRGKTKTVRSGRAFTVRAPR